MRKTMMAWGWFFYVFLISSTGLAQPVDSASFRSNIQSSLGAGTLTGTGLSEQSTSLKEDTRNFLVTPIPFQSRVETNSAFESYDVSRKITDAILAVSDSHTRIAPSHIGHPGYEDAAFLYDKAVDALVFKAAGQKDEARAVLDYFAERLRIPASEVRKNSDANGIYGILKLFPSVDNPKAIGFVNAFNSRSIEREGEGKLEYWTTPGPLAFLILAFLNVAPEKYLPEAQKIGDMLLVMQREDGAVIDGDRNAANVHTEPHMDSYSAFLMLYDVTRDQKWKAAADKAWAWFVKNVYRPEQDIIFQGIRGERPSEIFATDTYSWTMAGRGGEQIPLKILEGLTERMLKESLSRVTVELPDGKVRTLTLVDFADVRDTRIMADRGGFHPMGSVEWIGGVILCLQKNAVRFWEEGDSEDRKKAGYFKALAEYFLTQALNSYYHVDGIKGLLSFYATGQWMATGHGWHTPYYYVKDAKGNPVIKGGSTIGAWPVLPLKHQNPFKLNDDYGKIYEQIPVSDEASQKAQEHVSAIVLERAFTETVPREIAEGADEIPELWRYNQNMFRSINTGDYYAAILWAQKVLGNSDWMIMAKEQQKRKAAEVGGLVDYPWGTPMAKARDAKHAIFRYPLLNEMGAAMWGMAVAQFKTNNREAAKAWIQTMMETIAYHQIYAPDGPGFWNALVSWETNPGGTALDAEMGSLYREVLAQKGLNSALPKVFPVVTP
ncbi:MAG: AGE family epimerase/isomerase [Candidatus Omnitrophica bacterium]|nr:AGE family epimerase/isomerase [Candidatus Omnitrophota bacterium]